ncbi:MAG TPA: type II toxin-antitoxin system ParD family antitoxin [Rhodanobacteraceae bacterium]|nr:type II toxin-antitoxin system ParD family antitoxin [Rhodanobacteraceae bacterium]
MNISLPDSMKRFVDQQVREGDYAGASDYVRELIRKDRDVAKLRALLDEGGASPLEGEFDRAYFDGLRETLHKRAKRRKRA